MTRTRYALINAVMVAAIAVALGYLTDNPNRLTLNIPCGLTVGFLYGWLSWPVMAAMVGKYGRKR